jgi:dTDP-4-amino-4,6-dideoxygalactose transaminase
MINYSSQTIDKNDIKAVEKVLKSKWLTTGPFVKQFETEIKKKVNAKYCTSVNSATSALHLACLALGVKKGDLVWTTSNTFIASANCALLCGAKVDLIDIELDSYNINIQKLEEKLIRSKKKNKLPKVLIPVHFAGYPCDMKKIYDLSKTFKFKIIEDASHAFGSIYKKDKIGNCKFSEATVFSFHPVKIITTGEGGAITTNNKVLNSKLQSLRAHGIEINYKKKIKLLKKNLGFFFKQNLG